MTCANFLGGRWLAQCLKRGFVLPLNHDVLEWLARAPWKAMLGTVSQARLCARAQPSALERLLRIPWLGVFWDMSSSGALCSHSTMPPSNDLREFLGRALIGTVPHAGLCVRAQPCRPRMALRAPGKVVGWDRFSRGALCSRSTMPSKNGFASFWEGC